MLDKIIHFVGSSCVGKTSVWNLIKDDPTFEHYAFVESLSRKLLREGKISANYNRMEDQQAIFDAYFNLLTSGDGEHAFYMSDRCVLDVVSFTHTLYIHLFQSNEKFRQEAKRQARMTVEHKDSLGFVFYFPPYWKVESDGERLDNERFRWKWDLQLRLFMQHNKIPFIAVPNVSPIERVEFIKQTLNNL